MASANGPADKADEIGAKSGERRSQGIFIRELELPKDQTSSGAVDKKIVPFDSRADC
jgi:hypothetical protein